jgi:hypothetical protein
MKEEDKPKARTKELGLTPATAEGVDDWFREAWPGKERYPDRAALQHLANKVRAVQEQGVPPTKRRALSADTKKYAQLFLRHLASDLESIEPWDLRRASDLVSINAQDVPSNFLGLERVPKIVDAMKGARETLQSLIDEPDPLTDPRNAFRFIADAARDAWRRAGVDKPSRAGLERFVKYALDAGNFHYAEGTSREKRPRSGKAKRPPE